MDRRGTVGRNYNEDHYTLLHTKYGSSGSHYENILMQYIEIFFSEEKNENFIEKTNKRFFVDVFAQKIQCRYTLEPPRRAWF